MLQGKAGDRNFERPGMSGDDNISKAPAPFERGLERGLDVGG